MKKALVTGCAGFIGSALSRRLLEEGFVVTGLDCLKENYDPEIKRWNLAGLINHPNFTLISSDILEIDLMPLLQDMHYVFHQAAIPGVRSSWGKSFDDYVRNNVLATQLLLEASKESEIEKFVYASSSSIYGVTEGRTSENELPQPISPYGVTKLAGEQLCRLYAYNYGVPTVSLRYFTVYGVGQRPDMAFHKFILAVLKDESITVYGDGLQTRDFTYVEDAVEANFLALNSSIHGEVFNIGGKSRIAVLDVIKQIGLILGKEPKVSYVEKQAGDPPHTWADIGKAVKQLGYSPKISLQEGLTHEVHYIKNLYKL